MPQHTLSKETPAILIDIVFATVAFFLGAGWWKFSGREFDKDTAILLG